MQEDIYAKKFKKAHRRLKIDSDGPAVIPDAVAAEVGARINTSTASIVLEMYNLGAGGQKESGSARRAAPSELDVDDEQTTELLQSFPIDVRLSISADNLHACYMIYLPVSVYVCVLCRLRRFWRCPCLSSRSWSALLVSVCLACFTSLSFRERRHLPVSSVRISLHLHNIQYYHYSLLSLKQCAEEELGQKGRLKCNNTRILSILCPCLLKKIAIAKLI